MISPPTVPRNLRAIAGAGLIETKRENIPLGTLVSGVVTKVFVKRGSLVKESDPLFQLDDRDLQAQLGVAVANLAAAEAQLERLMVAPQQGDIPNSEAAVEEAKAHYRDSEVEYRRSEALYPAAGRGGHRSRPRSLRLSGEQSHPDTDGGRPQTAEGHLGEG